MANLHWRERERERHSEHYLAPRPESPKVWRERETNGVQATGRIEAECSEVSQWILVNDHQRTLNYELCSLTSELSPSRLGWLFEVSDRKIDERNDIVH